MVNIKRCFAQPLAGPDTFYRGAAIKPCLSKAANKKRVTFGLQPAQRGHDIAVSALLAGKAAIEIEGPQGETALIAAARRGHAAVVSLLLKAGADWKRQDHTGRTALRHAQDAGRGTIVTMLRRAGATQ
jgi:ankyrin repeat protein